MIKVKLRFNIEMWSNFWSKLVRWCRESINDDPKFGRLVKDRTEDTVWTAEKFQLLVRHLKIFIIANKVRLVYSQIIYTWANFYIIGTLLPIRNPCVKITNARKTETPYIVYLTRSDLSFESGTPAVQRTIARWTSTPLNGLFIFNGPL